MQSNCLLCGVGGQGTVLAAKLIAFAAMEKGFDVRTTETIGMAQRGGSVVSHVRFGKDLYSPMIPKEKADIIIGFEPAEVVRNISYLNKDGVVIINKKAVKPVTAALTNSTYDGKDMIDYLKKNVKKIIIVDGDDICEKCGSTKVLNIVLLAIAVLSGKLGISQSELENAITKKVPKKFIDLNLKAVNLASDYFKTI